MNSQSLEEIAKHIDKLPADRRMELLRLLTELDKIKSMNAARTSFLAFVKYMWPDFVEGSHHRIIAKLFDDVIDGKKRRVIINMAPRHTKSEFASVYLPAYFLGRFPKKKIIETSHTAELAVGFGRKVRSIINSEEFQTLFPNVSLSVDSKAAGRWATNLGGEYFAIGVNGAVSGKGADLLVIDDPHPLVLGTEIPTPNGFVRIEELAVGDEVYGPEGLPTKVTAKSPVYLRPVYRVTTSDGQEVECGGGHLWPYMSDTNLKKAKIKTATAKELVAWDKANRPCLPRHFPVEYPKINLPIDPWVLGAWLGDGTASLGRMTAHPDDQPYMKMRFLEAGYKVTELKDRFSFGVLGLREQLIREGLLNNKHVPEKYLTSSVEQRMALLQGLVDTDGNVTKQGQCAFHNSDENLVRAVIEILHSLGVKAMLTSYEDKRGWKTRYRTTFKLFGAASMPRKLSRTYTPNDKRQRSYRVEETGYVKPMQCISVEREDGLFLAGRGYVVTHNSEQDAIIAESSPEVYDKVMNWYEGGPRQRLQPGGAIIQVATRWSLRDLTGQLIKKQMSEPGADQWEVIELPAVLEEKITEDGEVVKERPIWPEFWSIEELKKTRASIPVSKWSAQYQQKPTSEEGALIKRTYWKDWEGKLPPIEATIMSWDTAFTTGTRSDYSACTVWGVFFNEETDTNNVILMEALRGKWEFPELKRVAKDMYDEWEPSICLIEARAAGHPLIFELRKMGIPVQDVTVSAKGGKGANDKIARVNAISDIFASGMVWARKIKTSHQEVIEECAAFPSGEHDDYVDTVTMALNRFRQGGWVGTYHDYDEDDEPASQRKYEYY